MVSTPPEDQGHHHRHGHHWYRGGGFGALLLIAIGVIFLLGNLNLLNWVRWEIVWPVVLIALGLWILVERRARP